MTSDDDERPIGPAGVEALRARVDSTADLGALRRALRTFLVDRDVPAGVLLDVLIAVSELTTNALQARSRTWPTEVWVELSDDADGGRRSIVATIDNTGEPYPGTLHVSPYLTVSPEQPGGRGLTLAARLGNVRLEGRIGGTRAVFERTI